MSILWEAAFPWVSYYTMQGYLYIKKKNETVAHLMEDLQKTI